MRPGYLSIRLTHINSPLDQTAGRRGDKSGTCFPEPISQLHCHAKQPCTGECTLSARARLPKKRPSSWRHLGKQAHLSRSHRLQDRFTTHWLIFFSFSNGSISCSFKWNGIPFGGCFCFGWELFKQRFPRTPQVFFSLPWKGLFFALAGWGENKERETTATRAISQC